MSVAHDDPPKSRLEKDEGGIPFEILSDFTPAGDQPQAIEELTAAVKAGERDQVLLGVTGSGLARELRALG